MSHSGGAAAAGGGGGGGSARGPRTPREAPKMTEEGLEKLVQRLYVDSITHKDVELKKLEKKYWPVAKANTKTQEQIDAGVDRQAVKELEMRKTRMEQATTKMQKERAAAAAGGKAGEPKKMSEEEVEESVRRLYTDCVRIRAETRARLEKKMCFTNRSVVHGKEKKLSKEALQASASRLCAPSKRTFNADEINLLWLNKETHFCDGTGGKKEDEEVEE
jgi:hypothetical protein